MPLVLDQWSYSFHQGQYDFESRHVFSYTLKNRSDRNIKLVDGAIVFRDLLGTKIYGIQLLPDAFYRAGQSTSMVGNWPVNTFKPEEMRLRAMNHEDIKPELIVNRVVFDDNSIWNAGGR